MLKHMDDGSELDMLVDDGGNMLLVCSGCKKVWTGKLALAQSDESSESVEAAFRVAMESRPAVFRDLGIDAEAFAPTDPT
jgi:hypothetical protein